MDAAIRSRIVPATAYAHALTSARQLVAAVEREDVSGALYAVTVWAAWLEASRKDVPK